MGMVKHTSVSRVLVTFSLPDWFGDQRLNYELRRIHPAGHRWAGQVDVDNIKYSNRAYDALARLKGVTEICSHPLGPWVAFEIEGRIEKIPMRIAQVAAKLERFLSRYRESRSLRVDRRFTGMRKRG